MDLNAVTVVELTPRDAVGLSAARRIYEESFPATERKPSGFIMAAAHRDDYSILLLRWDAVPVGFAVIYMSKRHNLCLLEYMAVEEAERGKGIGSMLFEAARQNAPDRVLLLEVEKKDLGTKRGIADKRKRFYRRLGCSTITGIDYKMPSVSSAAPPLMELMVCGLGVNILSIARLASWLDDILKNVYAVAHPQLVLEPMLQRSGGNVSVV